MAWLVEAELADPGDGEVADPAEALVGDRPGELHALRAQVGDGRVDVVAHQVELVPRLAVGGMDPELGGREGEDQPAAAGVDGVELEHVAEELARRLRVAREDRDVDGADRAHVPDSRMAAATRSP